MSKEINQIYEFGEFRMETGERLLLRNGKPISLTGKAFNTLRVLVQSSGHLVGKDELMKQVWSDAFVEEANLSRNIWVLRKALGDTDDEHRYIETVPKLGYRFLVPVTELTDDSVGLLIQRRVTARIVREELETSDAPHSEIPVTQGQTASVVHALQAKPGTTRRWIALAVLATVALSTTLILSWSRLHAKPTVKAETGLKFLTNGQQDDNAGYWTNRGEIYFSRYLTNTRFETWKMNADGSNQRRANTEIKSLLIGRWSPDGKKVVFVKEDDSKFYLADADGTNEITLSFAVGNMDWSQDSSQFVYQVRTGDHNSQIFLYTIKTRQTVALTDNRSLNADPSFSPDGKQIVFVSDRDKNANIYVMQSDGSNLRRLTDDQSFDNYPVFSPDGTQVAFQSNREDERVEVYLKNLNDDTPPRRLTHSENGAGIVPKCWSPDGTQILLYTNQSGKDQILLADVDPPPPLVLAEEGADLTYPQLSSDGKEILYQARKSDRSLEIRLTDLQTRRTRTIFKTEPDYPSYTELEPSWSPDNSLIAFCNRVNNNSDIFSIRTDGSGLRDLSNNPLRDAGPTFSPDGNEIVFVREDYGRADLYRMDLDGGNQRRVTSKSGHELNPAYSPDGNYVAFAGDREGHGLDIFLLNRRNPDEEKVLAARRFHDTFPAFSADGKRIAFIANSDGNPEIYLVNSDGSAISRITHSKAQKKSPPFFKDRNSLLFAANRNGNFAIYQVALQ